MSDFNYIFGSLRTEAVIQEIPLYGVYMDMQMNYGGQFQGTFQLDQTGKNNEDLLSACTPGKTWVTCERNGIPVWHGFIWSRVYSAQSKSIQLFALSFEQYARKRLLINDYNYTDVEQRNIFLQFWLDMQSVTGGNLNINVPSAFPTVKTKNYKSLFTDFKYANEAMSELADTEDGFDWYISIAKDGILYRKDLVIGYPNLGVGENPGMVVFEYPGNITQYYYTEPMADAGTDVYVLGAGEGSEMLVGYYEQTLMKNQGWPRWDVDVSRKDIANQGNLNTFTTQTAAIRKPPMSVMKLNVRGDITPEFGTYNLGDTCKVVIEDPRFPRRSTFTKRLVKWELTPQSADSTEEASLVFEGDPDV